jgi:hypothetical protein
MTGLEASWTRRLFERTGIGTVWVGVVILALSLLAFLVQELALGRLGAAFLDDIRITSTHLLIVAYLLTASVFCEQARDASIAELSPLLDPALAGSRLDARGLDRAVLLAAGLCGAVSAILVTLYMAPGPASYDPRDWEPENAWHRVLSIPMGFLSARLSMLILIESTRLSDLAASLRPVDLLDQGALAPFARRGLSNALLAIGMVSAYALFLVDIGYLALVSGLLVVTLLVGALALLLPLRGVRARIRETKQAELAWCRERLRRARAELAAGAARTDDLQELLAWESRAMAVSEWPLDASTFTRFSLYLLIPLGSWAGGALVERVIDAVLD